MKKIIALYIGVVLLGSVFTSCERFIDLQPLDKISTNDYWKTDRDLGNYMLQFYPVFMPNSAMVAETAINSDDLFFASPSTLLNGERTPSTGNWQGEWANIRRLNIFFENYHKCESSFESYKQYLGEAHFFKAWFYFELLKKYGDLPWYASVLQLDDDEALARPRDPRTLVADSIIAHLDDAVELLDNRSVTGNNRISKEAALAFKSRVALYEGTWQKYHANTNFGTAGANSSVYFQHAVDAATDLINGNYSKGIYSTGNPDVDYFNLFGFTDMSNINEVLLYKAFNAADGFGNTVEGYLSFNNDSKAVTWELISSYLKKDGTPYDYLAVAESKKGNDFLTAIAADCDPRLKSTIWIPGDLMSTTTGVHFDKPEINGGALQLCQTGFRPKKSTNPNNANAGQEWTRSGENGFIILRYGEVLLNYAEAKYELDQTVAYDQLNLLRARVGLPDFVVHPQEADPNKVDYGYAISDELYEIRRERRVEMALEGHRDEDLMRWAAHALFKGTRPKGYPFKASEFPGFTPPLDGNGLIDYWENQLPNGYGFREDQDYLYSIPQDERTLNPNLDQNPGW